MTAMQDQAKAGPEGLQAVDGGGPKADRRRVIEVPGPGEYLRDPEVELPGLHQNLRVEAEVDRVAQEGNRQQQLSAVCPVARMQVGQFRAHELVLDCRQGPVGYALVEGHAGLAGRSLDQHPRPEHEISVATLDRLDQLRDQLRLILTIGVEHDHDLSVPLQRLEITGLLIASIADVVRVPDDVHVELTRDLQRLVRRVVVDEDDLVDERSRDRANGDRQGLGRIERRHHDHGFRARARISHREPRHRRFRFDPAPPRSLPRRPRTGSRGRRRGGSPDGDRARARSAAPPDGGSRRKGRDCPEASRLVHEASRRRPVPRGIH